DGTHSGVAGVYGAAGDTGASPGTAVSGLAGRGWPGAQFSASSAARAYGSGDRVFALSASASLCRVLLHLLARPACQSTPDLSARLWTGAGHDRAGRGDGPLADSRALLAGRLCARGGGRADG